MRLQSSFVPCASSGGEADPRKNPWRRSADEHLGGQWADDYGAHAEAVDAKRGMKINMLLVFTTRPKRQKNQNKTKLGAVVSSFGGLFPKGPWS